MIELQKLEVNGDWVTRFEVRRGLGTRPLWKMVDQLSFDESVRWVDRFAPLEGLFCEWAAVQAYEKALGIRVPAKAEVTRAILAETQRLVWLFDYLHRILRATGDFLLTEHFLRLRDLAMDGMDIVTGARLLPHCLTIGGCLRDLSIGENKKLRNQLRTVEYEARFFLKSMAEDGALVQRLSGVSPMDPDFAASLHFGSVLGQATGLKTDLRLADATGVYGPAQIEVFHPLSDRDWLYHPKLPVTPGDVWQRVRAALFQVRQSLRLIDFFTDNIPGGPVRAELTAQVKIPDGMWVAVVEAASGPMVGMVSKRGLRLTSHSTRMAPVFEKLLTPIPEEDLQLALAATGLDMGQVDLC